MNISKTSAQVEIKIRMIDTTYIALIGKKRAIIYTILRVSVSQEDMLAESRVF